MFAQEEKKQKLVNAQRKSNDFRNFFESQKLLNKSKCGGSTQRELFKTYSTLDIQQQELQQQQRMKDKQYIKDSKVDKFLNNKIKGKELSDSQSMDKFLIQQKDWATRGKQVPISQVIHDKYMKDPDYSLHYNYQTRNNTSIMSNSYTQKNTSSMTNLPSKTMQSSAFAASSAFNGPPRFWLSKNSNTTGNTTLNEVVADSIKAQNDPQFMCNLVSKSSDSFDIKKLNLKNSDSFLKAIHDQNNYNDTIRLNQLLESKMSPEERKKQLYELKQNLNDYQKWKKDNTYKKKQIGLLQNRYRSGVLSLDGPFVDESIIYQEQNQKVKDNNKKKEMINKERATKIQKYFLSNPDIDFANKNNHRYLHAKSLQQFPHKSHQISSDWKSRKLGNNLSQKLPTFENCFGHNLEDQKQLITNTRSQYLREKDLGGKNFNPLTGAANESLF